MSIREVSDSLRDLTGVQCPSRVNEIGHGGWFKAWTGPGKAVEVNGTQNGISPSIPTACLNSYIVPIWVCSSLCHFFVVL